MIGEVEMALVTRVSNSATVESSYPASTIGGEDRCRRCFRVCSSSTFSRQLSSQIQAPKLSVLLRASSVQSYPEVA